MRAGFLLAILFLAGYYSYAAFAELDHGIRKRYSGMVWLMVDPRMDPLRKDPRFASYLKRVGFPPPA